jgi:hypothetical protein
LLDKLKANIRNAYQRKTGIESDQLQQMMDAETWLDSVDAVALGFADAIEEGVAAAASVNPADLRARFDNFAKSMDEKPNTEVTPEPQDAGQQQSDGTVIVPEPEAPVVEPETVEQEPVVVDPEPENKPADEPLASLSVNALIAKIHSLIERTDAAEAKFLIVSAECNQLKTSIEVYKAEADMNRENHDRLARSLGIAAASVVPEITAGAGDKPSLIDEYQAIEDPAERSAFYRKHRAELSKLIVS